MFQSPKSNLHYYSWLLVWFPKAACILCIFTVSGKGLHCKSHLLWSKLAFSFPKYFWGKVALLILGSSYSLIPYFCSYNKSSILIGQKFIFCNSSQIYLHTLILIHLFNQHCTGKCNTVQVRNSIVQIMTDSHLRQIFNTQ